MMTLLRWFCLFAFCMTALPAAAEMLPGADDPAYVAVMERALAANDPDALRDLYALAEAGNHAAIVALPTVSAWIPIEGSLSERNKFRKIGGQVVSDLAAELSELQRAWQTGGLPRDHEAKQAAALLLFDAGETSKASILVRILFGGSDTRADLPEGFADLPGSSAEMADKLWYHMIARPDSEQEGLKIIAEWLTQDRLEGWLVIANIDQRIDQTQSILERFRLAAMGRIFATNLGLDDVDSRADLAGELLRRSRGMHKAQPATPETLEAMRAVLAPLPEFAAVAQYCALQCPESPHSCETAFIAAFGNIPDTTGAQRPLNSALPEATFLASPRGEHILFAQAIAQAYSPSFNEPTTAAWIRSSAGVKQALNTSACFTAGFERAMAGPLPGAD